MTKRTLLETLSNIDDAFVEEAAHPEKILGQRRSRARILTSHKVGALAACLIVAVGLVLAVPYMNGMQKSEESAMDAMTALDGASAHDNLYGEMALSSAPAAAEMASDQKSEVASSVKASEEAALSASASKADMSMTQMCTTAGSTSATKTATATDTVVAIQPEVSDTAGIVTTMPTVTTQPPMQVATVGEIEYMYMDGALYSLKSIGGISITDLEIPEALDGETITEIYTVFWGFVYAHPNIQTVKIPDTVKTFGNVSALSKSVIIICAKGSAAETFFTENGYTVQTPQP